MLSVDCIPVGALSTNCYIVYEQESLKGIIIDPGDDPQRIMAAVDRRGLKILGIYLTHGHFDHVLAVRELKRELNCRFHLHRADEEVLELAPVDARVFMGRDIPPPPRPDGWVSDGDVIRIGGHMGRVVHTPGHTPGSVCYVFEGCVFTGDTLFAGSIGRTDLHGGDQRLLIASIMDKLFTLPDDYMVYPGHGPSTMLGVEKRLNPFVGVSGLLRGGL